MSSSSEGSHATDLTQIYLDNNVLEYKGKVKEKLGQGFGEAPAPPAPASLQSELRDLRWLLEVDDEAGGDPGAIGVPAGGVKSNVVHLGAEGQMGEQADVHAAAKAIGKLAVGAAARPDGDARAAKKDLPKWIEFGRVAQSEARAEEIGVGV